MLGEKIRIALVAHNPCFLRRGYPRRSAGCGAFVSSANFAATIFFGTEQEMKQKILVDSARFHFMDSVRLWFNRSGMPESPYAEASGNTITLSEEFYREISAHPIPVEREVIAAPAASWTFTSGLHGKAGPSLDRPHEFRFWGLMVFAANLVRLSIQSRCQSRQDKCPDHGQGCLLAPGANCRFPHRQEPPGIGSEASMGASWMQPMSRSS